MIYLLLAILSSVSVSVVMRLSSKKAPGSYCMLAANYLMCLLIAGGFTGFDRFFPAEKGLPLTLMLGIGNGLLYLISFILYQRSVKKNGMVLSSTFMKLGLLVPIALSLLVFWQIPSLIQCIGFIIALLAIVLIQADGKDAGGKFSFGLILLLITGGGANAMSELYDEIGTPSLSSQFLLYTFLTAFIVCLCIAVAKRERPTRHSLFYGFLIGIPNYFSARFLLLCLADVPAFIAHPTYSAVSVCAVSVLGICLFCEKLTKRQWLGVGIILISLILLNI